MVKYILTSFPLFFTLIIFGQAPNLDSLQSAAERQQGVEKIKTLNTLSQAYFSSKPEQAKIFAETALEAAIQIDDWKGAAIAHDNLGRFYESIYDSERAMASYLEGLKMRSAHQDNLGEAVSRINMGRVFLQMEDFGQAEENLLKALKSTHEIGAASESANALKLLGDLYLTQKIYGKSLDQYRQALDLKLSVEEFQEASKIAAHLGQVSGDLGDQEGAITYYQTSLNLYREMNDQPQIAVVKTLIAKALAKQKLPIEAMAYDQEAYLIRQALRDTVGMAENLKNIGLAYFAMANQQSARSNLKESEQLLEGAKVTPLVPKIYEDIAEAYSKMGDNQMAFQVQKKFSVARNVNFNQEKAKALLDLTTRYESEFEAREKQAKIELLEVENANSRKISYFLFVVVGLVLLLLTNLMLSYRRKQEANKVLLAKNEEILRHKNEIDLQNEELAAKNTSLDLLNKKLVDEIAERENIEKSSFARDRFLATMSHEMRTPLNVITGLTHLLLQAKPRPDQVEQLRTLQFSANDLVVFINDVLDFSKIEAGKLNLEDRPFVPAQIFNDIQDRFEDRANETGILFNLFQDPKLPRKLLGDSARLSQILTNLLTNTFQHTQEGYVKVDVSLHELKAREAMLEIVVEGSDGGVKRQILEEIFKPWSGMDGEFDGYEGQHFSLTITKRLVELQNGKMDVEVKDGESTAFYILLPFKLVQKHLEKPATETKKDFSALAKKRILIVEDNKINQIVVAKMLRRLDMEVSTADNGLEALDVFDKQHFDLILMDIQMPEMDGYRATAEIRRHPDPTKRDVPIIALTASAFLTEKEKAVLFGMNDHVGKPFGPEELLEKIQVCLEVYQA